MWCILLILVTSFILGYIFEKIKIPSLIGMLCAGLLLRNIVVDAENDEDLLSGLPEEWAISLRELTFCVVMVRSGLEIDVD